MALRLLSVVGSWQDGPDMPVPNGYLLFLVMEEAPGVMLVDFWEYDRAKRARVRESFDVSLNSHSAQMLNAKLHVSDRIESCSNCMRALVTASSTIWSTTKELIMVCKEAVFPSLQCFNNIFFFRQLLC